MIKKLSQEELKRKQKNKRLYETYGITIEDWEKMFKEQNGVCWICQTLPKSGILCVDHLHKKGYKKLESKEKKQYVRALICFQCNTAFGRIERRKEPRKLLGRIVEYFKTFSIKGDE